MDLSLFLAKVLGLYFIIMSISFFLNKKRMTMIITDILDSPGLLLTLGFNVLVIGILLVVSHNLWTFGWPVLITIIGWLVLIKGILNVAFPTLAKAMSQPFLKSDMYQYVSFGINLLLGVLLCYFGFFAS